MNRAEEGRLSSALRRGQRIADVWTVPKHPPGLTTMRMAARPSSFPAAEDPLHPSVYATTLSIRATVVAGYAVRRATLFAPPKPHHRQPGVAAA
jgi:hypothetical protein